MVEVMKVMVQFSRSVVSDSLRPHGLQHAELPSLQCHIFLPFHTVHGVLKARILKWFAIPFSSGPHFVRTLLHDASVLSVAVQGMVHNFIELDKAVVHVNSLINFL